MVIRVVFVMLVAVSTAVPTWTQERFSFFAASTPESVERMLTLAKLQDNDVVVDLGSGDGLIPLTAARMNRRLRGLGVDINQKLVDESNQRAKNAGVADRVRFELRNAFDADLREATVITMWLFPELMRLLRPIILERAAPGARVLTRTWDLGSWKADEVDSGDDGNAIFMWSVPARVEGGWDWDLTIAGSQYRYAALLEQHFQTVEGVARAGDRREVLESVNLRGADIAFAYTITLERLGLTRHEFKGKVAGEQIAGMVTVTPAGGAAQTMPWRARRSNRSNYFAPTGLGLFQQP